MKKSTVLILQIFLLWIGLSALLQAQVGVTPVYVNEIHYDNDGADVAESIEVAGPAGTDLSDYLLYLYNGQGGLTYAPGNPFYLNGIIPDQGNGYGTLCFAVPGIQNGSPDGLAIVYFPAGALYPEVKQFISYEGYFPANNGPALGDTSADIGVRENSTSPIGYSLQLGGIGFNYEDFLLTGGWQQISLATCGAPNNNQTFQKLDYCTNFLDFWMTEQSGPAIIDTNNLTVNIEVITGSDLTNLIPYFDLCFFATVTDTATGNPVISGGGPMDFSNPVVWYIDNKKPGKHWTITVTEQIPDMVINELDIEQPGADLSEFIELKNNSGSPVNITGMKLMLLDGATSTAYANYTIPSASLGAGEYFVICANPANTMNCDFDVSPDINLLQDGTPDAVALYTATGSLVDVVSYGGNTIGYAEGGGTNLTDDDNEFKVGLSRYPDGIDSDDNDADISLLCISPGYANSFDTVPCICTITDVYLESINPCDSFTSTFEAYITIEYAKAPGSGYLVVNGNNYTVTGSPQTVLVPSIPATGNPVGVNIYFSEYPACAWSSSNLFTAPPACGKCYVTSAWAGTQTSCLPLNNFYSQEIFVEVMFNPGGQWVVQIGDAIDTVDFVPQSGNTGLLTATGLISDSAPALGIIYNILIPGCVFEINGQWTAPANCYDSPAIVVNEADYDQPGTDGAEFIELKNNESFPVSLKNYFVELINGGSGLAYDRIQLPDVILAAGDYFVMCANPSLTDNCDLDLSTHLNLASNPFSIDDGAPDAIALYDIFGTMVDVLSYEGDVAGYVETSGVGLVDDDTEEGHSLSRYPDGIDTDNNSLDFKFRCNTPGEPNTYLFGYCGPFHSLDLLVNYNNSAQTIMPRVQIDVANAKGAVGSYVSDNNGKIFIDSLGNLNYTFSVDASVYPWGWGGVNALDALIQIRHFTSLQALYGDFLLAGDVIAPVGVNSTDALRTSQRFAGVIHSFDVGDWYPVQAAFTFNQNVSSQYIDTLSLLCFGDVNGSHIPLAPLKASDAEIYESGQLGLNGSSYALPFVLNEATELGAVSLKLVLPEGVEIVSLEMKNGAEPDYTLIDQVLQLSWFDVNGMKVEAGGAFLTIRVNTHRPLNANEFKVEAGTEFANSSAEVLSGIKIGVPSIVLNKALFELWPNPGKEVANVRFSCTQASDIRLELINMLGADMGLAIERRVEAGEQLLHLEIGEIPEGSYLVKLLVNGEQQIRPLIIAR